MHSKKTYKNNIMAPYAHQNRREQSISSTRIIILLCGLLNALINYN